MKRSGLVRRVLLGGLSVGALAGGVALAAERITPESYLTNDTFVPGAGYYHAPFRGFFAQPYNYFDAARQQYFFGGRWGPAPHRSIVNISAPTPEAAQRAETLRTDVARHVPRAGFGSTAGTHSIRS